MLQIDSKILNSALKKLAAAYGRKALIPIYYNVLLEVTGGELRLTLTNMELTIVYHMPWAGDSVKWLLPYKEITAITNLLVGVMEITVDENRVCRIECGKDKFDLGTLDDGELFTKNTEFEPELTVEVDGAFFFSLQKALVSTVKDISEFERFCCICLHFVPGEMRVLSSARSNFYMHRIKNENRFEKQVLFYPDFVRAVRDFEAATLEISERFISAKTENLTITATLSEQKFPNYDVFIPSSEPNCFLEADDLKKALDKIAVYGTDTPAAELSFSGGIDVAFSDIGTGRKLKTFVPAEHTINGSVTVLAKLLSDVLTQVPPDAKRLGCIIPEAAKAIWVKPESEDDVTLLIGVIQS